MTRITKTRSKALPEQMQIIATVPRPDFVKAVQYEEAVQTLVPPALAQHGKPVVQPFATEETRVSLSVQGMSLMIGGGVTEHVIEVLQTLFLQQGVSPGQPLPVKVSFAVHAIAPGIAQKDEATHVLEVSEP